MLCADCFLTVDANNNLSVKYVLSENAMMVILKGIFNYIVELIGTLFVENKQKSGKSRLISRKTFMGFFLLFFEKNLELKFNSNENENVTNSSVWFKSEINLPACLHTIHE